MKKAILGKKVGMSQIFTPDGKVIPVTVVEAGPCTVVQVKTKEKEGYDSIQVAFGAVKDKHVSNPAKGHFKKAAAAVEKANKDAEGKPEGEKTKLNAVTPKKYMREFRLDNCAAYTVGSEIKAGVFAVGDKVDVIGKTRGRGFTGVIQRWNQTRGPMAHGSGFHRAPGSMGAHSDPSRVFKNKHLAGQYGNEQVTIKNLEVVRVDEARNLLLIKGGIPGAKGTLVFIRNV